MDLKKLTWEKKIWKSKNKFIAGIDEAGRGPLAGPVVAAAVIFPKDLKPFYLNDSKKLSPLKREKIFEQIVKRALTIGVGFSENNIIDEINILQATYRAMRQAISKLIIPPDYVLVDGREIPDLNISQTGIVKGDQLCYSIAAASIIAKVTRDRLMVEFDKKYPQYLFAQHKGYPTKLHIKAIQNFGYCPIHRQTFKIRKLEENGEFK